ncbi:histone deacetylase, partial [Candidatus Altiarchaeota archaeon]
SLHQDPSFFYPGRGFLDEIGESEGEGYTVNVPFPGESGDIDYQFVTDEFLAPLISDFDPEFIFISAGFDSHKDDAISSLRLGEKGYSVMAKKLMELSGELCQNRLALELEGGYNSEALALSLHNVAQVFLGEMNPEKIDSQPGDSTKQLVSQLRDTFRSYHSL